MKYSVVTKLIASRPTMLFLIVFLALLVACQGNTSSGAGKQPDNSQGNAASANSKLEAGNSANRDWTAVINAEKIITKVDIQITKVPPKGAGPDRVERIAGTVSGVNIKECKVVVFAHTDTWYVQPYFERYDTEIQHSNTWHTDTHLGSEYAALLVKNSYKAPTTTGRLPEVGGEILAIVVVEGKP